MGVFDKLLRYRACAFFKRTGFQIVFQSAGNSYRVCPSMSEKSFVFNRNDGVYEVFGKFVKGYACKTYGLYFKTVYVVKNGRNILFWQQITI